jgi:hypothetical protein
MKEKELAKFVDWLVQSGESPEGASFDETVSWINELATSEEGQQILGRLIKTYKNKEIWTNLMKKVSTTDFSWLKSAEDYKKLYDTTTNY